MSGERDRAQQGPADLLAAARELMSRPAKGPEAGAWPRAAALLIRQALEESLDQYWQGRGLALDQCSARAQFICLAEYAEPESAAAVSSAWSALSRACHHHVYELPPTAAELKGWLDVVEHWHSTLDA